METTIIYKSNKREFHEIKIGEFFMHCGHLYIKTCDKDAFDVNFRVSEKFNAWEDVTEPKVTITVET